MEQLLLRELLPREWLQVSAEIEQMGRPYLSEQVPRVILPAQGLSGGPDAFSFMAYPWPRLADEQRVKMALVEWETLEFRIGDGTVALDLDDFGQINWVHVRNLPDTYHAIKNRSAVA